MRKIVIADAGGTKTRWKSTEGDIDFLGLSIHPRTLVEEGTKIKASLKDWDKSAIDQLLFYGAGCAQAEKSNFVKQFLLELGFRSVTVYPDTLAVCHALLGKKAGIAGICGTGSVLMKYNGLEITQLFGGLGPHFGDEGSGMYFGKLVVAKILNNEQILPKEIQKQLKSEIVGYSNNKSNELFAYYASLAKRLNGVDLFAIHHENFTKYIRLIKKEFDSKEEPWNVHISGSYAYSQCKILEQVCLENNCKLVVCIDEPIDLLVKYHKLSG